MDESEVLLGFAIITPFLPLSIRYFHRSEIRTRVPDAFFEFPFLLWTGQRETLSRWIFERPVIVPGPKSRGKIILPVGRKEEGEKKRKVATLAEILGSRISSGRRLCVVARRCSWLSDFQDLPVPFIHRLSVVAPSFLWTTQFLLFFFFSLFIQISFVPRDNSRPRRQ